MSSGTRFGAVVDQPPSMAVVSAVAQAEGVDPVDLREPLGAAIDPDALDALLNSSSGEFTFEYYGYSVVADGTGNVQVTPVDAPPDEGR